MEYLKIQGIPRTQILFAFFGKRRLISQDDNINRRVESRIVYRK
jgi:outer membrane protein OmpA-like peptidoglycan-associated protein